MGEQADRLVRIVDKHLPKVAAENRAYVMRYPHKVHEMLKKAWALRRRLRAKKTQKMEKKETKRNQGDRDAEPTSPEPAERDQDERGNPELHVTKGVSDAEAAAPVEPRGPEHTDRLQDQRGNLGPHATKEASFSEVTPPDWGGEEEESSPEGQDNAGTLDAQWPWGPAGRPSDQEAGQMRPSEPTEEPPHKTSGPTDTPSKPAGEPPAQPRRPDDDSKCGESKNTWHARGGTEQRLELRPCECSKSFSVTVCMPPGGGGVLLRASHLFCCFNCRPPPALLSPCRGTLYSIQPSTALLHSVSTSSLPLASTRRETTKSDPPYCHCLLPLLLNGAQYLSMGE